MDATNGRQAMVVDFKYKFATANQLAIKIHICNYHLPSLGVTLSANDNKLSSAFSKIKVWDLAAALDPRSPPGTLCIRTLVVRLFMYEYDK